MKRKLWHLASIIMFIGVAELIFLTKCSDLKPLTVATLPISEITYSSATSGGNIINTGGDVIDCWGVCFSTSPNPTTANSVVGCVPIFCGSLSHNYFISTLEGLQENTSYYVRAYAGNSAGTSYGSELNFTTQQLNVGIIFNPNLNYGSLSDVDGNLYKSIKIGSQVWMAQNLAVTKYRDGTKINKLTDNFMKSDITGTYSDYQNDAANGQTFGHLYNFYAVMDKRGLCPSGWHMPADTEWTVLEAYLGSQIAGSKLKEIGTFHWNSPNDDASNESGFTALPGGFRSYNEFYDLGIVGYWWNLNDTLSCYNWLRGSYFVILKGNCLDNAKTQSYSVRCLKD